MLHGWIPPERYLAYQSWKTVATARDREQAVIILPLGTVEQHGHHLPLIVDSAIAAAVVGRALTQLDPAIVAYALPPLCYGKSTEHDAFPGTITLSTATLTALLMDMGESLYRSGWRKWLLVNAHGGQPQLLEMVARDLHQRHADFWIFPHFVWRVQHNAADLLGEQELTEGIHAGDAETSLLLAMLPQTVDMRQAKCHYPAAPGTQIGWENQLPVAWLTKDLSPTGLIGNATTATAAKGEQLWQSLAERWAEVITEIYHWQPVSGHSVSVD